jgi:drug/metabolite transporter (DMT)-like permease
VPIGEVAALGSALLFACNSVLLRWLSPRVNHDVVMLNALRCLVATVLFVGAMLLLGRLPELLDVPLAPLGLLLAGVVLAIGIGDSLYFHALRLVGVARAQPISMSYPLITTLLAATFLGEAITVLTLLGIVLVVCGVYGIATAQAKHGRGGLAPGALRRGVLLSVVAAACWSCGTTLLRPALEQIDLWVAATIRMAVAALLLQVWAVRRGRVVYGLARRDASLAGGVLLLGVGTALSIFLFLLSVYEAGAARAATLSSTSPLFGVPLAVFVLKEQVTWRLLAGVGVTLVGVWLIVAR